MEKILLSRASPRGKTENALLLDKVPVSVVVIDSEEDGSTLREGAVTAVAGGGVAIT
jgi:hypothetical protein